jgi:hypothetical protein
MTPRLPELNLRDGLLANAVLSRQSDLRALSAPPADVGNVSCRQDGSVIVLSGELGERRVQARVLRTAPDDPQVADAVVGPVAVIVVNYTAADGAKESGRNHPRPKQPMTPLLHVAQVDAHVSITPDDRRHHLPASDAMTIRCATHIAQTADLVVAEPHDWQPLFIHPAIVHRLQDKSKERN